MAVWQRSDLQAKTRVRYGAEEGSSKKGKGKRR